MDLYQVYSNYVPGPKMAPPRGSHVLHRRIYCLLEKWDLYFVVNILALVSDPGPNGPLVYVKNSVDTDETPHYAAFDLGLHCLLR